MNVVFSFTTCMTIFTLGIANHFDSKFLMSCIPYNICIDHNYMSVAQLYKLVTETGQQRNHVSVSENQ